MRKTIKSLEEELKRASEQIASYKTTYDNIKSILIPEKSSSYITDRDMLNMVHQLIYYKNHNQGAVHPERETIEILKEIIRWQVNPETAQESKVREKLELFKSRGW